MRVVGTGALNLDFFYEVDDLKSLPGNLIPGGESWGDRKEFLTLREILEKKGRFIGACGGGSAANTIYALKQWGFDTAFIGIVGADEEGEKVLSELKGVDLSRVIRKGETGCCLIVLDAQKDRAIFVSPHSQEKELARFAPQTRPNEWLHLSSLVTEEGFHFHLKLRERHPGPFSLDPGEIYARRGFSELRPLMKGAEIIFLTEQELSLLKEETNTLKRLTRHLCLKKGKAGALLINRETYSIPPAETEKIVDNTGAGDVFNAGVLAGLLSGLSFEASGRLAASLAALSLRDYGRLGYPSKEEFTQRRKFYGA